MRGLDTYIVRTFGFADVLVDDVTEKLDQEDEDEDKGVVVDEENDISQMHNEEPMLPTRSSYKQEHELGQKQLPERRGGLSAASEGAKRKWTE